MGIAISLNPTEHSGDIYPSIQLWRYDNFYTKYYKHKEIQMNETHVTQYRRNGTTYWIGNMSFVNGIDFNGEYVVGYMHPRFSRYKVNVERSTYTLISVDDSSTSLIYEYGVSIHKTYGWRPLIQFTVGRKSVLYNNMYKCIRACQLNTYVYF